MIGRVSLWVMALLSVLVAIMSYRFLAMEMTVAFQGMDEHIANRPGFFILHIAMAPVALLTGLPQYLPTLRKRWPAWHRWTGRIYALAVLFAGIGGLGLAVGSLDARPVAGVGFALLALAWLGVTARAVQLAMQRRLGLHRKWMIRSFALTFAAVTLRLQLPFLIIAAEMSYAEASNIVAWMCWVPNIVVVEVWLRRRARMRQAAAA